MILVLFYFPVQTIEKNMLLSLNKLLVFLPHLVGKFDNRFIGRGFAIVFTCFAEAYSRPDPFWVKPGIFARFSSPIVIQ